MIAGPVAGEIAGIVVFVAAVNVALLLLHPPPLRGSRAPWWLPWTLFLSNYGLREGEEDNYMDGAGRAESKNQQCPAPSYFAFERMDPDDMVRFGGGGGVKGHGGPGGGFEGLWGGSRDSFGLEVPAAPRNNANYIIPVWPVYRIWAIPFFWVPFCNCAATWPIGHMGPPGAAGVQRLLLRLHRGVGAVRTERIRLEAGAGRQLAGLVHKLVRAL